MRHATWAALAAVACSASAAVAEYPEKPVEVIMPWPAGVSTDVGSRIVVEQMAEELGVPMQIIAKPGGAGVLGTMELANARPDGYTVGTITVGPAVTQVLMGNTPYGIEDLEPVGVFMTLPFLLLAGKDAPYDDLAGLAEYAAANEIITGSRRCRRRRSTGSRRRAASTSGRSRSIRSIRRSSRAGTPIS